MNRNISALERSRQILKELELEEKRYKNINKPVITDTSMEPLIDNSEGISVEGSKIKTAEPKPVNEHNENTEPEIVFNINQHNIVNGIILSEILGKPVSRRRGRW